MNKDDFAKALISASDTRARLFLLEGNSEILQVDIIYTLKELADQLERDDARQALEIGHIAEEVAEYINNDEARAVALWTEQTRRIFLPTWKMPIILTIKLRSSFRQLVNYWKPLVPASDISRY